MLPSNIAIEPEMIPLSLLPMETVKVEFVYRANELKVEEGNFFGKIVSGTTATREIKLNYKAEVFKCPLKFMPLKIDFPSLQTGEQSSHIVSIRNFSA